MRLLAAILITFVAAFAAGCGSADDPAAPQIYPVREATDPLPRLPRGFEPYLSFSRGLHFARPPGWRVRERSRSIELRAPDGLVVLSLSVDRTDEALQEDLKTFPGRVFSVLSGYAGRLDPSEPRAFRHAYEAFAVEGHGVAAKNGLEQNLRVIALRHDGVAVITAVLAENAKLTTRSEARDALEILASMRTRPPATAAR